jgi:medium-chain acyl-[acyl-carrier-protein] hydrolase
MTMKPGSSWIARVKSRPALRLFCFPYAGGGASIFRQWGGLLPSEIDVCPIYLPGRESRLREPAFTDMTTLVQTLTDVLRPYIDVPFALAGHSMGGVIAFEFARALRANQMRDPAYLFVSAQRAPQLPPRHAPIHHLTGEAFNKALARLGGTPQAVLEHKELMELLFPVLRADFTLYENYSYTSVSPLDCPISAFYGEQDHLVSEYELAAWREQTSSTFAVRGIPGNHFFIHGSQEPFLHSIAGDLRSLLPVV